MHEFPSGIKKVSNKLINNVYELECVYEIDSE